MHNLSTQDLAKSGINKRTQALIKLQDTDELEAIQLNATHAYKIPYFDIQTNEILENVFRYKLLKPFPPITKKYHQPKGQLNHLYCPVPMLPKDWKSNTDIPLIITEGEKKALKANQEGFPAIAVSGVWSWKSQKITGTLEDFYDTETGGSSFLLHVDDPQKAFAAFNHLVSEMSFIDWTDRDVTIIFDADYPANSHVQQAAFELGMSLFSLGANPKQVILPSTSEVKLGLDDFLETVSNAKDCLPKMIQEANFPTPVSTKQFILSHLTNRANREVEIKIARAMVADLDTQGKRFRDSNQNLFYFHKGTSKLYRFPAHGNDWLSGNEFGQYITRRFGITSSDSSLLQKLRDFFASINPCPTINPHKVIAKTDDNLYLQISDSEMVKIGVQTHKIVPNGTDDILFASGIVKSLDSHKLTESLAALQLDTIEEPGVKYQKILYPFWKVAVESMNLKTTTSLTLAEAQELLIAQCYIAPYLNRFKGIFLPMEITVAEADSGKTYFYQLRRGILTGFPEIDNFPQDFRSWLAVIADAPGIYVGDNLSGTNPSLWRQINDELARLLTSTTPEVKARKLYTDSDINSVTILNTLAVTTIRNPFTRSDILQRSLVFTLAPVPEGERNPYWIDERLKEREKWIAEQVIFLQEFLGLHEHDWDTTRLQNYRLPHYEQTLLKAGKILGLEHMESVVEKLQNTVRENLLAGDNVFGALQEFQKKNPNQDNIRTSEFLQWVSLSDWSSVRELSSDIAFGKYLKSHEYMLAQTLNIRVRNKDGYRRILFQSEPDSETT